MVPADSSMAQTISGKWKKDKKGWWYEYSDGSYAKNEFIKYKGDSYYFNAYGYMVKGWRKIKSKEPWGEYNTFWYYFKSDGSMAKDEYIKGYYFDSNGICYDDRKFKWKKEYDLNGNYHWIYVDGDNESDCVGWVKIDNVYYYFGNTYAMGNHPPLLTDMYVGSDKDGYYYVNKNGAWKYKGKLFKVEDDYLLQYHWYGYYKDTKGWVPRNCILNINGHKVKFDSNGKVLSYWWHPAEETVVKYPN